MYEHWLSFIDNVIILLEPGASLENVAEYIAGLQTNGDTELIIGV